MTVPKRPRGVKRSSSLTIQRQLLLVRCLQSGAHHWRELIDQINLLMPEAYPAEESAARAALRHDLKALTTQFDCQIDYHPQAGYQLRQLGMLGMLHVPAPALNGLRFLATLYATATDIPEYQDIQQLLERITSALPPEYLAALDHSPPQLHVVGPGMPYQLDSATIHVVYHALRQRRELAFRYQPSLRPGEEAHRVAPCKVFIRDNHVYLLAYCYTDTWAMEECVGGYIDYRIDYIIAGSAHVLPRKLPPTLPQRPTWIIRYHLDPVIAVNQRVAHWFDNTVIDYRPDGSAVVTATVHNLWQTHQTLMRYLHNCRVLEPPALVDLMRQSAAKLGAIYPPLPTNVDEDG